MSVRIPHWLEKQAELNPDRTALESVTGEQISFMELRSESRKMAQALVDAGVKPGQHVAFLSANDLIFPIFIHAVSYIGAVVVLLNTRLTASEIAYQLKDAQVRHMFVGDGFGKLAEDSSRGMNVNIQQVRHLTADHADSALIKDELLLDDIFTMMYTSGTTGKPKAVMHSYGNHWYSAIASSLNLGLKPADKWLICLPLFHVGGFSLLMKSVIYGMPVHVLNKFDASHVNRMIIDNGVTHVSVVTVMLHRLLDDLGDRYYPDHFRCMLLGGGPVPERLLQETSERQIPVFQTYGMTETSSQIATLSPESAFSKIGSAGKALSLSELWIDNKNEEGVGEILVRGPMVSEGYYNRPARKEDFLRTGDLGYKDEDGFLYVVDRVKDTIISGGENVYPAEIESVLSTVPTVKEAGVTGRSDEQWGEVPVAFLVAASSPRLSDEEIVDYCRKRLGKFKIPAAFYWVDELPRNASNKLLRRQLFDLLGENSHEN